MRWVRGGCAPLLSVKSLEMCRGRNIVRRAGPGWWRQSCVCVARAKPLATGRVLDAHGVVRLGATERPHSEEASAGA